MLRTWRRFADQQILTDSRPWVRTLSIAALCIAIAAPIGAILGLLGGVIGAALIVAAFVGYMMLRYQLVGLVALVGVIYLLPFAASPIDFGFTPTLLNLVLGVVFFVWVSRVAAHKDRGFNAYSPTLGVLVFVLLAIFSFIAGLGHASLSANVIRHFGEIILSILTFLLVINTVRTAPQLRLMTTAIIVAGFAAAAIGVGLYLLPHHVQIRLLSTLRVVRYPSGADVLRFIEDDPSRPLRAIATSVDPNLLGGALVFVATLTTTQIFAQAPVLPKRLLALMAAIMAVCMFLTYSRGSLVGLATAIAMLAILRYRKLIWIGLAALLLLVVLPPTQAYLSHFIAGLRGEDLATQMRFGEIEDALIMIGRNPWFGVGFAGTPDIDTYIGVSNVYLQIAQKMGIIGVIGFVVTLFTYLGRVLSAALSRATRAQVSAMTLGYGLAVAGAMMHGMFDHHLFNLVFPHTSTLLWLFVGLGVVSLQLDLSSPGSVDHAPAAPLWKQLWDAVKQ